MFVEVLTIILFLLQLTYFIAVSINVIVDNKLTNILMVILSSVLVMLGMIILIQSKISNETLFANKGIIAIVLAILIWNVASAIVSSIILAGRLIKKQVRLKEC